MNHHFRMKYFPKWTATQWTDTRMFTRGMTSGRVTKVYWLLLCTHFVALHYITCYLFNSEGWIDWTSSFEISLKTILKHVMLVFCAGFAIAQRNCTVSIISIILIDFNKNYVRFPFTFNQFQVIGLQFGRIRIDFLCSPTNKSKFNQRSACLFVLKINIKFRSYLTRNICEERKHAQCTACRFKRC